MLPSTAELTLWSLKMRNNLPRFVIRDFWWLLVGGYFDKFSILLMRYFESNLNYIFFVVFFFKNIDKFTVFTHH